jgi:hypothetical protein
LVTIWTVALMPSVMLRSEGTATLSQQKFPGPCSSTVGCSSTLKASPGLLPMARKTDTRFSEWPSSMDSGIEFSDTLVRELPASG